MMHEYTSKAGEVSSWIISHLDESDSLLAYHALEAGKLITNSSATCAERGCFGKSGYLILYSCSGEGEVFYDGKRHKLPAKSVVLLNCKNIYELGYESDSGQDWVCYWLRFDGYNCGYFYDTINAGEFAVMTAGHPGLEEKFEHIMQGILTPGTDSRFRISHGISGLLTYLVDLKLSHSPKRHRHQKAIGLATAYIRENYVQQLDIDRLAAKAKLSKYYFIKLFKEFMCVAPYEYVIIHRVNEAKKYLRGTQLKISQISDRVGFNDECNFIRTFKRVTGSTPLQYREAERVARD